MAAICCPKKAYLVFEDTQKENQLEQKVEKLEQIIGKQTIEIDF